MSKAMEEYIQKIVTIEKETAVLKMITRGKLTVQEIAEDLNLPLETVQELNNRQLV